MRSSLSLSLVVHAFLVACLVWMSQHSARIEAPKLTWIELEPDVAKRLEKQEQAHRQQIVQTDEGERAKQAARDAFLGEKTQIVDRQTVNQKQTTLMAKPSQRKAQTALKNDPTESSSRVDSLSSLGVQILPKKQQVDDPDAEQRWAEQGQSPQDYIKGIRESERTALNTKEFVFYGYFQRIRERLDRAWVPILRERLTKMYRSGRSLASDMDHTTKVVVVLNNTGEITKVQLISESGVRDLDDAAIRAFNQAGPFPNPPRGIVDANGEIQIPWEFVLKT